MIFTESFENDTAILSLLPSSNNGEMEWIKMVWLDE
jgi:hypothetical protein